MGTTRQTITLNEPNTHKVPFFYSFIAFDIFMLILLYWLYNSININIWFILLSQLLLIPYSLAIIAKRRVKKWNQKMNKLDGYSDKDIFEVDSYIIPIVFAITAVIVGTVVSWKLLISYPIWIKILIALFSLIITSGYIFQIYIFSLSYKRLIKKSNQAFQNEDILIRVIPSEEMKSIFHNDKLENIWAKESGNNKYSLFLMIFSNEASLWYGDSVEKACYHCKLRRFIESYGTYSDGLSHGVYEFEIVNIPQLDFSYSSNKKHIGEVFYMDRKDFDELFVIPLNIENTYNDQLRNTIGLEETNFLVNIDKSPPPVVKAKSENLYSSILNAKKEEIFDSFPVNLCETSGTIKREPFVFEYETVDVWQGGKCIFSDSFGGTMNAELNGKTLNITLSVDYINEFIVKTFSFGEISTNINRVIWSKDLFNVRNKSEKLNPDIASLFFKNGSLFKITFNINESNTLIEFIGRQRVLTSPNFEDGNDDEF